MGEEKKAAGAAEEQSVLRRMEKIEALLTQQVEQGRKSLKASRIHTVVLVIFVAVFAVGVFAMNATLHSATRELPAMLSSITQLTDTAQEDLAATVDKLDELDFTALNETIRGIASIRFDALSESIEALQSIIKPFADFMSAFG